MEVPEKCKFSELSFEEVNAMAFRVASKFLEEFELEKEYLSYGPVSLNEIDPEKIKLHNDFNGRFRELLTLELSEEEIDELYEIQFNVSEPNLVKFGAQSFKGYLDLVEEYIRDGSIDDEGAKAEIRKLIIDAICVSHHKIQTESDIHTKFKEIRAEIADIKKTLMQVLAKLS